MIITILEKIISGGSEVLLNTEEFEDDIMELGVLEIPPHGTLDSSPGKDVPLGPEEMLPVIGNVGEDSAQTPHVSRGLDVRVVSSENLRGQVADGASVWVCVVVHCRGGLA